MRCWPDLDRRMCAVNNCKFEIDFCNCGCVSVKLHDQSNSTNTAYLHHWPANVVITIQWLHFNYFGQLSWQPAAFTYFITKEFLKTINNNFSLWSTSWITASKRWIFLLEVHIIVFSMAEIKISCHLLMAVSERVRTFYSKV